jgi:hypothetical protein
LAPNIVKGFKSLFNLGVLMTPLSKIQPGLLMPVLNDAGYY